jgi:hypothetical protein
LIARLPWSQASGSRTLDCGTGTRFKDNSKLHVKLQSRSSQNSTRSKCSPGKLGYWRGILEVARLRSETSGEDFAVRILQANAWAQLDDHEKAVAWLEKCVANGNDLDPTFIRSPIYDPLNGDPRFVAALRKLNLAP